MTAERLAWTRLAGDGGCSTVLLVGPSLGTAVGALWRECARVIAAAGVEVIGWDLPGHGRSAPASEPFLVDTIAERVRTDAAELRAGRPVAYAGVSLGGAVGLALAGHPGTIERIVAIASAPRIGEAGAWYERAELVRAAGTAVMVGPSSVRWFAPGFTDRRPDTAGALLTSLAEADADSYAFACEALAVFDATDDVRAAVVPVLLIAGEHDAVVTPAQQRDAATTIPRCRTEIAAGCGHLPPAEAPAAIAALVLDFLRPARPAAQDEEPAP